MLSLRSDLRAATAAARQNLTVMEKKIDELNAALDRVQPEAADPAPSPEAIEPEPDPTGRRPTTRSRHQGRSSR
jgi:hypothetical protein